MNLLCCEHPQRVRVFNMERTEFHYEYVPCGKCNTCRMTHVSDWVSRLNDEAKCWPFVYFVTLTYDDEHVPTWDFDGHHTILNQKSGEFVDLNEFFDHFDAKSRLYLHRRHNIFSLDFVDVQKFFKRLRFYLSQLHSDNIKQKNYDEKIRYFLCGEYGETTLRPHYHMLLFFNSPLTASKIEELLNKAWQLGHINAQAVRSSAAAYVAAYVNSIYCLPKIYTISLFRPKCVCSKCPSIGSLIYPTKEVLEIFHNSSVTRSVCECGKNDIVPLRKVFKSAIFPKLQDYDRLTHFDRITLYGIARFSACDTFEEFYDWLGKEIADKPFVFSSSHSLRLLYVLYTKYDKHPSGLKNLFTNSLRVLTQSRIFNVTLEYYVERIEAFYNNLALYRLASQYRFQSEYALCYPHSSLLCYYSDFVTELDFYVKNQISPSKVSQSVLLRLESLGVDASRYFTDVDYRSSLLPASQVAYKAMLSVNAARALKARKTKRKNDYILAHPERANLLF